MNYEYRKLRGKIIEVFGTMSAFSKALDLSENSLSKKMNGKTQFNQKDMSKWCNLLNIPLSAAGEYFFS